MVSVPGPATCKLSDQLDESVRFAAPYFLPLLCRPHFHQPQSCIDIFSNTFSGLRSCCRGGQYTTLDLISPTQQHHTRPPMTPSHHIPPHNSPFFIATKERHRRNPWPSPKVTIGSFPTKSFTSDAGQNKINVQGTQRWGAANWQLTAATALQLFAFPSGATHIWFCLWYNHAHRRAAAHLGRKCKIVGL